MKVLVLGAGKMTEAILVGLKASQELSQWMIYSPSGQSARNLSVKVGARSIVDLAEAQDPDWILVGCKPQQLPDLKKTLAGRFQDSLYVSMLAALSESDQARILGVKNIIRIMPNLPVENKSGVTLLSSESSQDRLPGFQALFAKVGVALVVKETELEELTLLTGSGPAFFYEFSKNLAASFTSLTEEERENLARQVLLGAAIGAQSSSKSLTDMTQAVTSKGGVTIAVLEAWRSLNFAELILKGVEAGKKRTEEIKSLLRK